MKLIKLTIILASTLALSIGSTLAENAKSESKTASVPPCCTKAKAANKQCTHRCCIDAAKEGKTCQMCAVKKEAKTEKKAEEKAK